MIYRLHASRFKALLRYIQTSPDTRPLAELEALRITEEFWYTDSANTITSDSTVKGPKERVWSVLCDTVMALFQCRKENPFFHRSVYRHAQALLWAPVFMEDTIGDLEQGSLALFAANQCQHLLGMDCEKTIAENAKSIIDCLFEKKRMQLCAVWVTTPVSPMPFEVLNDSTRKYDTLRWKYCSAYIDCLRLCKKRDSLETFINWIDSAARDLPSFYEKSADVKGAAPKLIHCKDNILLKGIGVISDLSRYANEALADVARQLLYDLSLQPIDSSVMEAGKELLYNAYTCFRRLNCSIDDGTWKSLSIRMRLDEKKIVEVEALCDCYIFTENATSFSTMKREYDTETKMLLLKTAVETCETIFSTRIDQSIIKKRNLKRKSSDITVECSTD